MWVQTANRERCREPEEVYIQGWRWGAEEEVEEDPFISTGLLWVELALVTTFPVDEDLLANFYFMRQTMFCLDLV